MKEDDFELLASVIGPEPGAAQVALHAHFVLGMTKAKAANHAGVSRATVTEYVSKWERHISKLVQVNWRSVKALQK